MSGRKRNYWNGIDGNRVYWTWLVNQDRDPTHDEAAENLAEIDDPPVELWSALSQLTAKQRFVLGLRFGYSGHGEHTLDEVANFMGGSVQSVKRIEERALRMLRWLLSGVKSGG